VKTEIRGLILGAASRGLMQLNLRIIGGVALAALATAGTAHAATYGVSASSAASVYDLAAGYGDTCTYPTGCTGGTGGTGSVSGNVNGTSASVTATGTSPNYSATGTVSTDLATTILNLSSRDTAVDNSVFHGASVAESAGWTDTLHYIAGGATVTPLTVSFTLTGVMSPSGTNVPDGTSTHNPNGELNGAFNFGSVGALFDLKFNPLTSLVTTAGLSGTGSWTTNANLTTATFSETYDLTGASGDISVSMLATLWCNSGMNCNYSVGPVALTGDVTFTSDSGVFLTAGATPGATPLPAALPLFATGLGALGLLDWRRKRKNAAALAAA
jgi:hypothetical protein